MTEKEAEREEEDKELSPVIRFLQIGPTSQSFLAGDEAPT